jgi:hypothetical protein
MLARQAFEFSTMEAAFLGANADANAPASLVCTVTPELYIGYFRELTGLKPGANGMLDPSEILEIMGRYSTEPYRG